MLGPYSGHAALPNGSCAGKQAGNLSARRRTRKVPITIRLRTSVIAMEKKEEDGGRERFFPSST